MYQNIMVPLDGSPLAECVLPHVESISRGCQSRNVVFVRVIEPIYLPSGGEYGFNERDRQRIDADQTSEAEEYLRKLVEGLNYPGVSLGWKLLRGNVADSLVEFVDDNNIDLVIIATHGRTGVSRWVWGSVADRLLRSICVPVLMVRAPGCFPGV